MTLSETDKKNLLLLAKQAICGKIVLKKGRNFKSSESTEAGKIKCGVFVSVYFKRKLRGCIGTFSEEYPLSVNVKNMAISASTSDSRFPPIQRDELDDLKIELSVLSPKKRISDKNEIILGKHGIYMEKDFHRGTFLPQVALEQKWSLEEYLGNCARYKAGIGWDGWKQAELYTFEADVFSSDEFPVEC